MARRQTGKCWRKSPRSRKPSRTPAHRKTSRRSSATFSSTSDLLAKKGTQLVSLENELRRPVTGHPAQGSLGRCGGREGCRRYRRGFRKGYGKRRDASRTEAAVARLDTTRSPARVRTARDRLPVSG